MPVFDDFFWFVVRGIFLMYAALLLLSFVLLYCLPKIISVLFPLAQKTGHEQKPLSNLAYEYADVADRYVRSLPVHD